MWETKSRWKLRKGKQRKIKCCHFLDISSVDIDIMFPVSSLYWKSGDGEVTPGKSSNQDGIKHHNCLWLHCTRSYLLHPSSIEPHSSATDGPGPHFLAGLISVPISTCLLVLQTTISASNEGYPKVRITEKTPTRAFSWFSRFHI